ncbi:MAG: Mur ligase family protein [Tissierellia bacterium]|nr:Mur ligase family protein [Tissierellia bacterium]
MNFQELANILNVHKDINKFQGNVKGLAYHSGKVQDGDVFFAIKGYETDGHKYIGEAKDQGAILAIVEEKTDDDIPQWIVKNSRIALADASAKFFKEPSNDLNIIGITATNGKTTTSFMVDAILKSQGKNPGIIGTIEVKYGDKVIPSILTTPESYELQNHLSNMKKNGIKDVIMEVSSSGQELYRNRGVNFNTVTFNNLSKEHIDQHGSFERYVEVKSRFIREANKDTNIILNMDYPLIARLKEETNGKVYTYSIQSKKEDFTIDNLDLSTGRGKYTFIINKEIQTEYGKLKPKSFSIELGAVGYSSVMNSIPAIITGLINNIAIKNIQNGLKSFTGVERRFELIYDKDFMVLDDHFANEKNIDATMETLKVMDYKDLYILYAIRGNRGVELNREVGERIIYWLNELKPKGFCATVSKDLVTKKDTVSPEEHSIFKNIMESNQRQVPIFDTVQEGLEALIPLIQKDDVLLLAGCQGMDKGAKVLLKVLKDNDFKDLGELEELVSKRIC